MHSYYYYLVTLDPDAPREGPGLFEAAWGTWRDSYEESLDENNWHTEVLVAERGGNTADPQDYDGTSPGFDELTRHALLAIVADLSFFMPAELRVNPFAFGDRGGDEETLRAMDSETLERHIRDKARGWLVAAYQQPDPERRARGDLAAYSRRRVAEIYERLVDSQLAPFTLMPATPYEYPAVDLRDTPESDGRIAIVVADIHT